MIYLDHAAATPIAPNVLRAMEPYFAENFYNASASYLAAKAVAKDINTARTRVAAVLGVRPAEIIFTAGGTEANNLAIQGIMQAYPTGNTVVSSLEHDSVLEPARKYEMAVVKALPSGVIDLEDIIRKINENTVLVSIMYVNNEIGTIQPITDVARIIKGIKAERIKQGNNMPLYFHTDACQAGNYLHLLADKLGVDLMTVNAGKLYGPKQAAVLYVKAGTILRPQILGGGQEWNIRSGTENPAACIGFAEALISAQSMRSSETKRLGDLRAEFIDLMTEAVPSSVMTATYKHIVPNNLHVTIPGHDNERLMMALDEAGIICAVGSACSASNDEPSHVLRAIGLTDREAQNSLRFTMGRSTTQDDIKKTVQTLAKLIV